jgi:hypothetical protein
MCWACADPGQWGIAASSAVAFVDSFVTSRAAIATSVGKPWILEEFGMDVRMHSSCAHLLWHPAFPCMQLHLLCMQLIPACS